LKTKTLKRRNLLCLKIINGPYMVYLYGILHLLICVQVRTTGKKDIRKNILRNYFVCLYN